MREKSSNRLDRFIFCFLRGSGPQSPKRRVNLDAPFFIHIRSEFLDELPDDLDDAYQLAQPGHRERKNVIGEVRRTLCLIRRTGDKRGTNRIGGLR